jgi:hypothetical protein
MKIISVLILSLSLLMLSAFLSGTEQFKPMECSAFSPNRCVDELSGGCPNGTIYTFSCASDICGNQTTPQCLICVTTDPGEN